jgi:hypothetical protein
VTHLDRARDEISHGVPKFLPDCRHFLFVINYRQSRPSTVHLASLDAPDVRTPLFPVDPGAVTFVEPPASGRDQTTGQILYMWEGALMARPFDLMRLTPRGDGIAVAGIVNTFSSSSFAIATRPRQSPKLQRTSIPQRVWEIRVDSVLKLDRAAKRESNDDSLEEVPRWGASPNHDRLKSTPRSFLEWGLAKGKVVDDHLA